MKDKFWIIMEICFATPNTIIANKESEGKQ